MCVYTQYMGICCVVRDGTDLHIRARISKIYASVYLRYTLARIYIHTYQNIRLPACLIFD
jgi:hypothetical protein